MAETLRAASLDVIYDGQCRFCGRSLALLQRLAGRCIFRLHDANHRQMIRSKFPMLANADTDDAMFVVTPRREVFRGFFAYRRIMWESPRLYPLLPLFYAPGAALIGPRIYAWVARHRRSFGCSLDRNRHCGGESGRAGRASDPSRGVFLRKAFAGLLGFLLLAATLAPIRQNWSKTPKDSFPFSYYPMFSEKRTDTYVVSYLVGLDGRGSRHLIPYVFAGSGGLNQTRRQINRLIREGKADTLCRAVAGAVGQDAAPPYSEVVTVRVVTGQFRFADYFAGNKTPMTERVRASCQIARGERTTEARP